MVHLRKKYYFGKEKQYSTQSSVFLEQFYRMSGSRDTLYGRCRNEFDMFNESLGGRRSTFPPPPPPQTEPGTCLHKGKMLARLIIGAFFLGKTFILLVCIRMYPYVSRMYPYVTRMLVVCIRVYPYPVCTRVVF